MTEQQTHASLISGEEIDELARMIKRASHQSGRGWCSTTPLHISRYLLTHGVTLPTHEEESSR